MWAIDKGRCMHATRIFLGFMCSIVTVFGMGSAFAQSEPLAFTGSFEALDLGFDSKWWPGETNTPDSGNPIQVRVYAQAAAQADAQFNGSAALNNGVLTLGPATGQWGYDFGAAVSMQIAINLSFELNNPLPIGDDINLGPWVIDVPFAPDFDLLNSQNTSVDSFLLDTPSTLADETEPISVYDLSLIEYLIGGIDLPSWALTLLQLDAGASLNVAFETAATLRGEAIPLSDGNTFTSEGQSLDVVALPPSYDVTAAYVENLDWDLTLLFGPTVFIKILGQRFDLPVITIPWKVLEDRRDMSFTEDALSYPVEAVEEGEDPIEGEIEGLLEGDEEPIDFPVGCAEVCTIPFCVSSGISAGLALALEQSIPLDLVQGSLLTEDMDGNGMPDLAQFALADSLLASPDLPNHCCIIDAWERNYLAVESMAGFGGDRALTDEEGRQLKIVAAYATLGEAAAYEFIPVLASRFGWSIDLRQLDPVAGSWLAAQGDADLDGVCNLGEYNAAQGSLLGFLIAATTTESALGAEQCEFVCATPEGEDEGETPLEGEQERWTLTIIKEGAGTGDVVVSPEQADYAHGQTVTLTVFLGANSVFFGWNGVAGQQQLGENGNEVLPILGTNKYTLHMNGNKVIRPHFYLYAPLEGEEEGDSGEGEGLSEGEIPARTSSADLNRDGYITLDELLRVIQLFNGGAYYCDPESEDGVSLMPLTEGEEAARDCPFHTSDYNPANWKIELTELLRIVQFFNLGGYAACPESEDGFCVAEP